MRSTKTLFILVASISALPAVAQQVRPDAGTLLEPNRQIPTLPATGGTPPVAVPAPPAATAFDKSVRLTPAAFRFQGNTVFDESTLAAVVAPFVGKLTGMDGLFEAAAAVRRHYRDHGYLLTEAYLPAQRFSESGGTVLIQVLEARLGKARVVMEGAGVSEALATQIVQKQLVPGSLITADQLERPVLLLRDLAGMEASATVEPGAAEGEADVIVTVKPTGSKFAAVLGLDNMGPRSAGRVRSYVDASLSNLTGRGDVLSARAQISESSASELYRVGYSATVGGYATRLGINVARADYVLGKEFAALGASGKVDVLAVSATQPLIRSRMANLYADLTAERKDFADKTTTPASATDRSINAVRLGVVGNFIDKLGTDSFTSYALSLTHGTLHLDAASLALDQSIFGLHTAGSFNKVNVELQRTMFISAAGRVSVSVQGQYASKNLTSAEKLSLGGPTGVRGYPIGEALGDSGAIVSAEYRHQLPDLGTKIPLFGSVFYDWGKVRFNRSGSPFVTPASETLSSAGIGLSAGTVGDYLLTAQMAWRTDRSVPTIEPDKKPRLWLSFQKWL
ncbi:ShlB/FhaC/HecB family hemolysin secretion/activation protein [Polaromonas sp.]|uniref:ShlB/FhaC/HecB family hemolysin secretion/activation protein n=1 Tax=Polaromonas sp. TaxID=1869339 RepID=UPI0032636C20